MNITPELLNELFFIDFAIGSMKWRKPPIRRQSLIGFEAGCMPGRDRGRNAAAATMAGD